MVTGGLHKSDDNTKRSNDYWACCVFQTMLELLRAGRVEEKQIESFTCEDKNKSEKADYKISLGKWQDKQYKILKSIHQ